MGVAALGTSVLALLPVSVVGAQAQNPLAAPPPTIVVDPPPPPPPPSAARAAAAAVAQAPVVPLNQTFTLHSRPGSKHTVFLDVDGGLITGTGWNGYDPDGAGPAGPTPASFTATPFSLDGTVTTAFSDAELETIQAIWQGVSEDFAPFDIDVTTQAPTIDKIDKSSVNDDTFGTTAMISNTSVIKNGCGCSGVAFVDVFDWYQAPPQNHQYHQPAWIFATTLFGNAKYLTDTTSHEVGHNLGLNHDGRNAPGTEDDLDYYPGHDMWGPIMGSSFDGPVAQWSQGEYQFPSNVEDDLAVIDAVVGRIPDDHGSTTGTATALPGAGPYDASGVITSDADTDRFAVTVPAGTLTFAATPAAYAPNLDIGLTLRTASTVLDADDPPVAKVSQSVASGLDATVSAAVPGGTYYVDLTGVGTGNPFTGYSGYGSLGRYQLHGTFVAATDGTQLDYTPVAPCAVYDSRSGLGDFAGPHEVGETRNVQVTGAIPVSQGGATACGVPADATAALVNVVALDAAHEGNLRVYAAGGSPPNGGVVNFASLTGQKLDTANAVAVPLSPTGALAVNANCGTPDCMANPDLDLTQVRLVVLGYATEDLAARVAALEALVDEPAPGATTGTQLTYGAVAPCAAYDSRTGTGAFAGPHDVGETRDVQVTGAIPATQGGEPACGVPAGAKAALVNVVAVNATHEGNLRAYAAGGAPPNGGILNFASLTGEKLNTANAVVVLLSAGGALAVNANCGTPDCLADPDLDLTQVRVVVLGYYTDSLAARVAALEAVVEEGAPGPGDGTRLTYAAVTPCAVYDSRTGTAGFAGMHEVGETRTVQVTGAVPAAQGGETACGVPAGAEGAFVNVVAVNAAQAGDVRAFAGGTTAPADGLLAFAKLTGEKLNTANGVPVPLSATGTLALNTRCSTPTCVGDVHTDVTHLRVVVLGYYTDTLASRIAALEAALGL